MATDVSGTFQRLQDCVNKFVQDSRTWQKQITIDKPTHPIDPTDQNTLDKLKEVEDNLAKDVQTPPADIIALRDQFIATEDHVTKAGSLYFDIIAASQTPGAKNKEAEAKQSFKHLIGEMNAIRPQDQAPRELEPVVLPPTGLPGGNSLFIALLNTIPVIVTPGTGITKQDIIDLTTQLFVNQQGNQQIKLTDTQISALLDAWQQVVKAFSDASVRTAWLNTGSVGTIEAIISFDALHSDLEILYNQLTTNVNRTTEDSLDSLLFSLY